MIQLDRVDPKFRILADQLFFTDRTDLNISNFKSLLGGKDVHFEYLWDRFNRGTEIFWEESFWINRFETLLSLDIKKIESDIETLMLNRFRNLLMAYYNASPNYHNIYIQFVAWTKVKVSKKENIIPIKELLLSLPHIVQVGRIVEIVKHFVPFLFNTVDDYIAELSKKIGQSARSFEVIKELEGQGIAVDKSHLFKMASNLLFKRVPNRPNRRSFFAMIDDPSIMAHLKSEYKPANKDNLLELVKRCEYKEIEERHLRNIKNLLELDASVADELMKTYADSLYSRGYGYKKANIQRLIRLCKNYSQFSPKKVLVYLSTNNRMPDIKHLVSAFPDLKPLIPFV